MVMDYSPYRQHASMTSGVTLDTWSKGWFANYATSTGATLAYSEHLHTGFPFSVAMWCRHVSAGTSGREVFHTDTDTGTANYSGWSAGALYSGSLNRDIFVLRYGNGGTTNRLLRGSSPPTLVVDDWYHVVFAISAHITGRHWINGVEYGQVWSGTATGLAHDAAGTARIGYDTRTSRAWTSGIADVRSWNRPITAAEVAELYRGGPGYGLLAQRKYWRVGVTAVAVSGTAAVTLASATASASGTQTISGTSSATLAAATAAGSGSLEYSGAGAATLAAATASASGSQTHSGTAAATLAAATSTASGTQTCSGTAAATLAAATCDASGTQGTGTIGTVAVTLAAATSTSSGSLAYSGTASATTGPATSTATGTQTCSGSAAAGTAAASCSASGSQTYSGTGSSSLATATATATGSVSAGPISGTVAVTLGAATATISGVVIGIAGPVFAVDCVGYSLRLQAAGETIRVQAETPDTVTTVR